MPEFRGVMVLCVILTLAQSSWSCVVRLAVCVDSWDDAIGAPGVLECCGAFVRFVPRILSLFFLTSGKRPVQLWTTLATLQSRKVAKVV